MTAQCSLLPLQLQHNYFFNAGLLPQFHTELSYKAGPRFGDLCSCSYLPHLPGFVYSIHGTWDRPFS